MNLSRCNEQFGIDDRLSFFEHPSGLIGAKIQTNNCTGEFYLQGAHVTRFQPAHALQPVLFMSEQAVYASGKALRGGIPICFPWFNSHQTDPTLPAHGWARNSVWELQKTDIDQGIVGIDLGLQRDDWSAQYRIRFGRELQTTFAATNLSNIEQSFEVALHSYFAVGGISQVMIDGDLNRCGFYDQLTKQTHPAQGEAIRFHQETDRIYYGNAPSISLRDHTWNRSIVIESEGSHATIVWNPWIDKAKRMPDFGDQEYLSMCCIETANVREESVRVAPGATHQLSMKIGTGPL